MAKPVQGRQTAAIEGDFVVFMIGTRPDPLHPLRWWRDIGANRGMVHMLKYLSQRPEMGLLGFMTSYPVIIQYWRSYEALENFARDANDPHLRPWRDYWKRVGKQNRSGIWHETYLVRAGEYEAIYANMPPTGLAKATSLVPCTDDSTSRGRLRRALAAPS